MEGRQLFTPIDRKPKRLSARKLQRVRNILANPQVSVLFDEYQDDWSQLAWVQIHGLATFVEAGLERERGVKLLEAKYAQYQELPLARQPVIVIRIESIASWRAASAP